MKVTLMKWILLELSLEMIHGAVMPPPWADPKLNPCAKEPRGWQMLFWPPDGKCYKIFQLGHPCPDKMELSPAQSKTGKELYAECRCPPKFALFPTDGKCYSLFDSGPCPDGFYFAPDNLYRSNITHSSQPVGACKKIPQCRNSNSVYWPKDGKCYQRLTKGPCHKGQLITANRQKIAGCACDSDKEMKPYRAGDSKCYQHFTRGPCKEKGHLFLPDRTCGCDTLFPHYHTDTRMCYELGTIGPCSKGEMFTILPDTDTGGCVCKPGNIRYLNVTSCHRPFTRGPCEIGSILIDSTKCVPQPCRKGELYFPSTGLCYKIATRGPCPKGKIISFDFETRPSVDGVSYNGVCICERINCQEEVVSDTRTEIKCDRNKGLIKYEEKCFKMYSRGPCPEGAWLAPQREGKELLVGDAKKNVAVCECVPGNIRKIRLLENVIVTDCLPRATVLAEYLNRNFTKHEVQMYNYTM